MCVTDVAKKIVSNGKVHGGQGWQTLNSWGSLKAMERSGEKKIYKRAKRPYTESTTKT